MKTSPQMTASAPYQKFRHDAHPHCYIWKQHTNTLSMCEPVWTGCRLFSLNTTDEEEQRAAVGFHSIYSHPFHTTYPYRAERPITDNILYSEEGGYKMVYYPLKPTPFWETTSNVPLCYCQYYQCIGWKGRNRKWPWMSTLSKGLSFHSCWQETLELSN